jgi:hypothetical protein
VCSSSKKNKKGYMVQQQEEEEGLQGVFKRLRRNGHQQQ